MAWVLSVANGELALLEGVRFGRKARRRLLVATDRLGSMNVCDDGRK